MRLARWVRAKQGWCLFLPTDGYPTLDGWIGCRRRMRIILGLPVGTPFLQETGVQRHQRCAGSSSRAVAKLRPPPDCQSKSCCCAMPLRRKLRTTVTTPRAHSMEAGRAGWQAKPTQGRIASCGLGVRGCGGESETKNSVAFRDR